METVTPVWYVQPLKHDMDTAQRMAYAAMEAGLDVVTEPYVPFADNGFPKSLPTDRPVVFLGSIGAVKRHDHMARMGKGFYPFAWCDWSLLSCRSYYARYGEWLLQREYAFYPLAEVARLKDYLYDAMSTNGKLFIRPDGNDKSFVGSVVHGDRFDSWYEMAMWDRPPKDMLCVVARPEEILFEDRVVVANGRAIAAGQYKRGEAIEIEEGYRPGSMAFAEQLAAVWQPHPVFVADVAMTPDGFRLVEIGSVNVAGFYGCDLRPIVRAMTDQAVLEWKEAYGEVPY